MATVSYHTVDKENGGEEFRARKAALCLLNKPVKGRIVFPKFTLLEF